MLKHKTMLINKHSKPVVISSIVAILSILTIALQPILTPVAKAIELNNSSLELSVKQGTVNGGTNTSIKGQEAFFEGKEIVQVAGGAALSLALDSEGQVYAWGWNRDGQLGDGTTIFNRNTPAAIDTSGELAGKKIVQVAAGTWYSFALDSEGQVYTWGL